MQEALVSLCQATTASSVAWLMPTGWQVLVPNTEQEAVRRTSPPSLPNPYSWTADEILSGFKGVEQPVKSTCPQREEVRKRGRRGHGVLFSLQNLVCIGNVQTKAGLTYCGPRANLLVARRIQSACLWPSPDTHWLQHSSMPYSWQGASITTQRDVSYLTCGMGGGGGAL